MLAFKYRRSEWRGSSLEAAYVATLCAQVTQARLLGRKRDGSTQPGR